MTWDFQQIEPQPARGKFTDALLDSPLYVADEKEDGDRRIVQFCGDLARFTSRHASKRDGLFVEKTANVPHISGDSSYPRLLAGLPKALVPKNLTGTVLDGEMVLPPEYDPVGLVGGKSKFVTSIMGSLAAVAIAKQQEIGWLNFVVFDCLFYKGKDIRHATLAERRLIMKDAVGQWKNPYVRVVDHAVKDKRAFLKRVVARGGEGVVLKLLDHRYGDKSGWVKWKVEWNADCVVMGFEDPKQMSVKKGDTEATITRLAANGWIGAVVIGQYRDGKLVQVSRPGKGVSGMDDATRADMTKNPKKWIGKVIEIRHNGREPTGAFRHPRFKRLRTDKTAKMCIYREDEV